MKAKYPAWAISAEIKSGPAIKVEFRGGEYFWVTFNANDQLMIVSSSSKIDWHVCANGALSLSPTPRRTSEPRTSLTESERKTNEA